VEEGGFKMLAAASGPTGSTFVSMFSFFEDLLAVFAE